MGNYGLGTNGMNMGMSEYDWLLPMLMQQQQQQQGMSSPQPQPAMNSGNMPSSMPSLTPTGLSSAGNMAQSTPSMMSNTPPLTPQGLSSIQPTASAGAGAGAVPTKAWGPTADAAMMGASMAMPGIMSMIQKDPYRVPPPDVDMPGGISVGQKQPFQMPPMYRQPPSFQSMLANYLRR